MADVDRGQVVRLILVQRKARLTERIHNGDARSPLYHDRLSGAKTELDLAIQQIDKYLSGDVSALDVQLEQDA